MTAWTDHVKKMASELGLSYTKALSDARVKGSYTKATRAPRKSKPKATPYIVPLDLTDEGATANRARAMERVKAMKAKRLANPPAPRVRKPMSDETKAMLKARRQAKKADDGVAVVPDMDSKKRRQLAKRRMLEVMGGSPFTMEVVAEPKKRKPMSQETKDLLKARKKGSKMKPPKKPTDKLTQLSADDMALAFNLLN